MKTRRGGLKEMKIKKSLLGRGVTGRGKNRTNPMTVSPISMIMPDGCVYV